MAKHSGDAGGRETGYHFRSPGLPETGTADRGLPPSAALRVVDRSRGRMQLRGGNNSARSLMDAASRAGVVSPPVERTPAARQAVSDPGSTLRRDAVPHCCPGAILCSERYAKTITCLYFAPRQSRVGSD